MTPPISAEPRELRTPGASASPGDAWTTPRPARARWLGRISYDAALAVQHDVHAAVAAGREPDTLLLLEHDSTYTAGRASDPAHFLVSPADLERDGHAVRETTRGGDVTWHGPGQLVSYPIVNLADGRRDVHRYLRMLEEVMVRTCAAFGVGAWREDGRTGAWTSGGKIASIGIRVARWTTLHGTALNAAPDLARFDAIVACGLQGARATSLARESRSAITVEDAARAEARAFADVFHAEVASIVGLS